MVRKDNSIVSRTKVFFERLSYTFSNLTVHGPSFIVRKDVHYIARFIYFLIYVQIWIAVIYTIRKYYNHYQENTIRFTTRADYLKWNTTFPSITVCEILNVDKIWALHQRLYGEPEEGRLDRFVGDIAFFGGTCHSCSSTCNSELQCPTDLLGVVGKFRSPCKNLFLDCKWNGKRINCCETFKPIQTEFGTCFSANNMHLVQDKLLLVAADYKGASAVLELDLSQDYEAFLHSPEDIPFWNMEYDRRVTVVYGAQAAMTFSIMDVVNEPEVSLTPPEVRKCRFFDELPDNYFAYNVYSYSVCITQCRIDAQLQLCNCTHHLSPLAYKNRFCDLEGLKCLTRHHNELRD
ncbi:Sodium channel protein Nach [Eumeta japonica]|uniref:Sodium channel protein Nach n=1 Tax=Eumeta variegata TaxID=151549 RepID=A0A4C1TNF7_EUMVA|nr:Sodium channel protein Nach [Eumeta japonica]